MQNPALIRPRPRANFPQMRTVRLPFTLSFTSHASTIPQSITAKALIDWNIAVGTS